MRHCQYLRRSRFPTVGEVDRSSSSLRTVGTTGSFASLTRPGWRWRSGSFFRTSGEDYEYRWGRGQRTGGGGTGHANGLTSRRTRFVS